jgi:tripartite-type tricarboxylate transporter receptor subunit TctC
MKHFIHRKMIVLSLILGLSSFLALIAHSQENKPIKLIVPFAPGEATILLEGQLVNNFLIN